MNFTRRGKSLESATLGTIMLRELLFFLICVGISLSPASAQDIDHDLAIGECANSISLGQPVQICRDEAGILRILPLNSSDRAEADEIIAEFNQMEKSGLSENDQTKIINLLQRVKILINTLQQRPYDTLTASAELVVLQERMSHELTILRAPSTLPSPPVVSNQKSVTSEPENRAGAHIQNEQPSSSVYPPPDPSLISPIEEASPLKVPAPNGTSPLEFLVASLAVACLALVARKIRSHLTHDMDESELIEYWLSFQRHQKLCTIWLLLISLVVSLFTSIIIFWLGICLSFSISVLFGRLTLGHKSITENEEFSRAAAEIASIYKEAKFKRSFRGLSARNPFLVLQNRSGLLVLGPTKCWGRKGGVYLTVQTSNLSIQSFHEDSPTRHKSQRDDIVDMTWRYPKRTDPGERDLRYNDNYPIYIVRHYLLQVHLGNAEWTFSPSDKATLRMGEAAFKHIRNCSRGSTGRAHDSSHEQSYKKSRQQSRGRQGEHPSSQAPHRENDSWRKVLGVAADASWEAVKEAHRALLRTCHPDFFHERDKDFVDLAHEKTIRYNKAFEEAKAYYKNSV